MADIDRYLNTWVSCIQMAGCVQVGQIDRGFLHIVDSELTRDRMYVISFNKKDNPSAREGFDDYKHLTRLPCGWALGPCGNRSFKNMQPITRVNLGEI